MDIWQFVKDNQTLLFGSGGLIAAILAWLTFFRKPKGGNVTASGGSVANTGDVKGDISVGVPKQTTSRRTAAKK